MVEQQRDVIEKYIPVPVGKISGASEPGQWKDPVLWRNILDTYRIMVTTPQVLLDALLHVWLHLMPFYSFFHGRIGIVYDRVTLISEVT